MAESTQEKPPFTIEQFYKFVGEGKLMASKCGKCGATYIPPRQICAKCLSNNMNWTEIKRRGKLITYTIIYVPPVQFQSMAPYAYGIIELEDGVRLPGIIKGVNLNDLRIGMDLIVDFDRSSAKEWPNWPRFFFRPP